MKNYTFESLSSFEFELLSRDLLQEDLQVTLESFPPGRDGGIDARWIGPGPNGDETIVVQCKHYLKSGFAKLLKVLTEEKEKLDKLKPERYILTTSVPLTAKNKESILDVLFPYCLGQNDIHGSDGLNNLLGLYENVEKRHYKLWLNSVAALEKFYTAPTFKDSESDIQKMRKRMHLYVQNESFSDALAILDEHRFCLIAGNPGIGKTTLAEALLIKHVDEGFQPIRITNKFSEIKGLYDQNQKQIFYYDDFLGKTGFDKTEHNEDKHLTDFLDLVQENPNWRFILTTREYILNTAKTQSEEIAQFPFKNATYLIKLEAFTRSVKARIFYNHLYFSSLPSEVKLALIEKKDNYKRIIEHPNYNPRVINQMTDMKQLRDIDLEKYFEEFISNLENPLRIWEHAFRKHISTASQHVLLLLSILPDGVTVKELEQIFQNFHTYRSTKYNLKTSPYDFQDALKELDGDFIQTVNQSSKLVVKTQNPSVRDFLEQHLADTDSDVKDLIDISDRFIQFRLLWNGRRGQLPNGLKSNTRTFIDRFENVINRDFEIVFDLASTEEGLVWDGAFSRFKLALEIYNTFPSPLSIQLVQSVLEGFVKLIEVGEVSLEDVESATIAVQSGEFPPSVSVDDLLQKSKDYFLDSVEDIYLFIYLANFVERFPDLIDDEYKERVEKKLNKKINHLASNLNWTEEAWDLAYDVEIAEKIADALGIMLTFEIEQIRLVEASLSLIEKDDIRDRRLYESEKEATIIQEVAPQDSEIDYEFTSHLINGHAKL